VLFPLNSLAAAASTYRDEFTLETFDGSAGPDAWAGPWIESGESDGPDQGAITVDADGHCHTGGCLVIGKTGPDAALVTRSFDSFGAGSIVLTFDYQRHTHGAGSGSVELAASPDGATWTTVKTYPLGVDDPGQVPESIDLTGHQGVNAAIRFTLVGGSDDTHMNVDNLQIQTSAGVSQVPTFNQDVADRTDSEADLVSIDAAATHPGGDTLTYSASGLPPGVAIDFNGLVSGTIGYNGADASPYLVTLQVADSDGDVDTDSFVWTVVDVNRPPAAADRTVFAPEDSASGVTIDLLDSAFVSDPDGDVLVVSSVDSFSSAGGLVSNHGDGTVTYYPFLNFDGIDTFNYTVSDGKGGSASAAVTVNMQPAPDPPSLDPVPVLDIAEGTVAAFTATVHDDDAGDTFTFGLSPGPDPVPAGASIDPSSGQFNWLTSENDGPGQYNFLVTVIDSDGLTDSEQVTINVAEANEAPILDPIADQASLTGQSVSLQPTVSDSDSPTNPLTFSAGGLPTGLSIDPATGLISGIPSAVGSFSVVVAVADGGTPPLSDSQAFTWTIAQSNRAPQVSAIADQAYHEGDSVSITVAASDPDGDVLSYSATGLAPGLSIDASSGLINGSVATGASSGSPYHVTVKVSDPSGANTGVSFDLVIAVAPVPTTTTTQIPPTTTTTSATTTTSVPPTTTTTLAAPPTPTTTPADPPIEATTTTSEPESTTTLDLLGPPPVSTTTTSTTPAALGPEPGPLTAEEAMAVKADLLVKGDEEDRQASGSGWIRTINALTPREGIAVGFAQAVESLRSHFLMSLALGMGVALLLLIGIDRDKEDKSPLARLAV
jgi:hypothetical protein